jgi:repressor LexA
LGLSSATSVRWKKGATPQDRTLAKIAEYFGVPVSYFTEEGNATVIDKASFRMVPLFESVSAGFGALAVNSIVDYVPAVIVSDCEALQTIAIRVHGDSMYPKIEDGDIVIVHKQDSVDNGTLAVVLVDNDEGFVKRVEYGPDWIHLISNNPIYPAIKFQGKDVLRVRVVGKVTKIIKEV